MTRNKAERRTTGWYKYIMNFIGPETNLGEKKAIKIVFKINRKPCTCIHSIERHGKQMLCFVLTKLKGQRECKRIESQLTYKLMTIKLSSVKTSFHSVQRICQNHCQDSQLWKLLQQRTCKPTYLICLTLSSVCRLSL